MAQKKNVPHSYPKLNQFYYRQSPAPTFSNTSWASYVTTIRCVWRLVAPREKEVERFGQGLNLRPYCSNVAEGWNLGSVRWKPWFLTCPFCFSMFGSQVSNASAWWKLDTAMARALLWAMGQKLLTTELINPHSWPKGRKVFWYVSFMIPHVKFGCVFEAWNHSQPWQLTPHFDNWIA